jgi:hypothetical protein
MDGEARLSSAFRVSALLKLAEMAGGFGAVLARGDSTAGAILLLIRERGQNPRFFERLLDAGGAYRWQPSGTAGADPDDVMTARRKRDPDLWVLELDVADSARFIAETIGPN